MHKTVRYCSKKRLKILAIIISTVIFVGMNLISIACKEEQTAITKVKEKSKLKINIQKN